MLIAGWAKTSLLDYPGKIASVVFTQGCNMNCFYCHNQSLIPFKDESKVEAEEIFQWLEKRKSFVEGVVITGGEPTLQEELRPFLKEIKNLGILVKLDTNGTRPYVLRNLLQEGLLDYIAMDIKAPFDKILKISGVDCNHQQMKESLEIIRGSKISYEFRTTLAPGLTQEDLLQISREIGGDQNFFVQKCRGYPNGAITINDLQKIPNIQLRGF